MACILCDQQVASIESFCALIEKVRAQRSAGGPCEICKRDREGRRRKQGHKESGKRERLWGDKVQY